LLEATGQQTPTVGRATVFRALQLLCTAEVLEQVRLADGQSVYVQGHPASHHHHLICNSCGRMKNIHSGEIGVLAENLAAREGFAAEGHTFEVYGLCAGCRLRRPDRA
jgi:Fur family ferric uptake transcriptional regulator